MGLVTDILNAKLFTPPTPPRDSWLLGTIDGTPTLLSGPVTLDGDTTTVTLPLACPCEDGDRVLTVLLGRTRMVTANLTRLGTVLAGGALINGATAKTTPADADMLGLMDSAASNVLKKLSWANVKTALGSLFALDTAHTDWDPTITCSGSMYATSKSVTHNDYSKLGPWVFLDLRFTCTLNGTASTGVFVTLPVAAVSVAVLTGSTGFATLNDGTPTNGSWIGDGTNNNIVGIYKNGSGNYATGAGKSFRISGFYRWA